MTKLVECNDQDCIFNENKKCILPAVKLGCHGCSFWIVVSKPTAINVIENAVSDWKKGKRTADDAIVSLYAVYIWAKREGEEEFKKLALEYMKEIISKGNIEISEIRKLAFSLTSGVKKSKGYVKDLIIKLLKEKGEIYRYELRNYGLTTGGSLTRTLRKLEEEGIIKIIEEVVDVGNVKQRVKKIVRGDKFEGI